MSSCLCFLVVVVRFCFFFFCNFAQATNDLSTKCTTQVAGTHTKWHRKKLCKNNANVLAAAVEMAEKNRLSSRKVCNTAYAWHSAKMQTLPIQWYKFVALCMSAVKPCRKIFEHSVLILRSWLDLKIVSTEPTAFKTQISTISSYQHKQMIELRSPLGKWKFSQKSSP